VKHSPVTPSALLTVAVGGALGALLRWGLGELVPDGGGFPWTTFAINLSGSFALALLPAWHPGHRRPAVPLLLGPGLLGGYTTLSTYSEQARALLDSGESVLALAYLLGTLAACLVAVAVASRLVGGSAEPEWTEDAP
jgi:fluoride exporter